MLPPLDTAEAVAAVRGRLARALPLLRLIGAVAAIVVVVLIAVEAADGVDFDTLTWWPLPIALLAAATWWLLLAGGWAVLSTGRLARPDVVMWCRTQVLRYLPGGFWAPVSRATVLRGSALDRVSTVVAENALAVAAAMTIGAVALAGGGRPLWALAAVAIAVPVVALRLLGSRTRLAPDRVRRATAGYVVAFLAYAVAAVAVQGAVSGWSHPVEVAGAALIAWAAGLAVVIAPSGLGVREAIYVGLLSSALPSAEAAAGAVTMRLVMVAAELAVLLAVGVPRLERRRTIEPG